MKKLMTTLLCLTLAIALSACGGEQPAATADGQLIYGSGDYTAVNPALYEHGEINSLLFNGLTAHDASNGVVPDLAESWSFDTENNVYTFNLRQGVKWHDGEPFTAADVKFTIEAIQDSANASEISSNYEEITAVNIVGDYTVELVLSAPNYALLDYLTVGILPAHLLAGKDLATDDFNRSPIGTGPYKLTDWDLGQSITLTANAEYYKGAPAIGTVIFKIVEDYQARALQLQSGELDLAQITPQTIALFEGRDEFVVYDMKTADYRGILYNFNSDFFAKHPELPNILSYGVDRQAALDSVLLGYGETAYSPLQAGPYNDAGMEKFTYDPAKTAELLTQAGWSKQADGFYYKNGDKCAFTISVRPTEQVRIDIANIAAQNLREIGVDAKVELVANTDWANQDAFLIGWGSPFDPDDHTYKVFGTNKGSNFSAYSNTKVDELLTAARQTEVESERRTLYKEFQQELAQDLPYTFIVYADAIYVAKAGLSGLSADTVLGHHGVGIFFNVAEWTWE